MSLIPVLHRLLVEPDAIEEKTASGIILALDKREQAAGVTGTVVAIGNTCFHSYGSNSEKEGISVGSKIYYVKYAGSATKDAKYIWLNDEDVLGVIVDE